MNVGVAVLNEGKGLDEGVLEGMRGLEVVPFGVDDGGTAVLFNTKSVKEEVEDSLIDLGYFEEVTFVEGIQKDQLLKRFTEYGEVEVGL